MQSCLASATIVPIEVAGRFDPAQLSRFSLQPTAPLVLVQR